MAYDDVLTTLYKHNRWANLRLLEACRNLTPAQLEAKIPGSFGTVHQTLDHFVTSERSYFSRISTGHRYGSDPDAPLLTVPEMIQLADETGNGLIEWAGKIQPDDAVTVDWEGTPRSVPKAILLTQVINHATEHREQVKAILTELGIEPPDLQGWEFFADTDTSGWQPAGQ